MKRILFVLTIALSTLLMAGCGFLSGDTTNYTASDLAGTWAEESNPQCYWVYTLSQDDTGEYYWGKTWDEAEDVSESDLEFHGNGWFKWSIAGNKLQQLHVMDISAALVPKSYTVSSCTSTTLILKDTYGTASTYKKVK